MTTAPDQPKAQPTPKPDPKAAKEPPVPSIPVRATKAGFYIGYRQSGDEFLIATEEEFSDEWMEKVEKSSKAPEKTEQAEK